jgi:hypothetical protein
MPVFYDWNEAPLAETATVFERRGLSSVSGLGETKRAHHSVCCQVSSILIFNKAKMQAAAHHRTQPARAAATRAAGRVSSSTCRLPVLRSARRRCPVPVYCSGTSADGGFAAAF